jgi:hypothetical protein
MSEPFTDRCIYCGSSDVLDDAWWCDETECWDAYDKECQELCEYEERTPLTRAKASGDLMHTKASVWGPPMLEIEKAAREIIFLAKAFIRPTHIGNLKLLY